MATKRPVPNKENCPPSWRFDFNLDDDDFEMMSKLFQPKNMQQSTSWGLKTFTAWVFRPQDVDCSAIFLGWNGLSIV